MKAEKYVNSIIKKLKCSGKKRLEIKQQLLSDIYASVENGETVESVMERMGSVDSAAKEFNRNMPETELKKYTGERKIKIISVIIVIMLLLACMIYWLMPKCKEVDSDGVFVQEVVEEQTKKVIRLLNDNDFVTLVSESADEMKTLLTRESIDNARAQVNDDWGGFQTFGNAYMSEIEQVGKKYVIVQINANYENTSVTYTITFDEGMKLAGLYMK